MSTATQEPTQTRRAKILLIDDDESEFYLVNELLSDKKTLFELKWVESLALGIEHLSKEHVDVIVLDLFLADSKGLETFNLLKSRVKDVPIVIMSGLDDEKSAVEAIQLGAQDFLVKDHVNGDRLSRVLLYAIKRNEIQRDPKNVGLIDRLTGLYNRQGFLVMAEPPLKAAQRDKRGFFVCYTLLNDLDRILRLHGAAEADHALLTAADILRESFRSSDLIARIGHDEFAILTAGQGDYSPKIISSRIKNNQKYYNAQFNRYRLSLSMCTVFFDPAEDLSTQHLITKGDHVFADYKAKINVGDFVVSN